MSARMRAVSLIAEADADADSGATREPWQPTRIAATLAYAARRGNAEIMRGHWVW